MQTSVSVRYHESPKVCSWDNPHKNIAGSSFVLLKMTSGPRAGLADHLFLPHEPNHPLKGNITFVCAHTAKQPDSFPPSLSWHQMLPKNVYVALVDYLYQGFYALNALYGTCVKWEFGFTNEISKRRWEKCITDRAEWTSSSVLHCNATVAAWRCENTRDVGAAL